MGDRGPQPVPKDGTGQLALPVDPPNPGGGDKYFLRVATDDNLVTAFIRVHDEAYVEMGKMLRLPSGAGDFIYIVGWDFRPDTDLDGTSVGDHLTAAASRGVAIRAMFFMNHLPGNGKLGSGEGPIPQNQPNVDFINALKTGGAIHDDRYLRFASHHQKAMVIKHGNELVGFCGGMDIHPFRNNWHDVHVKVEGPGAFDLHQNFVDRWTDHPLSMNPSVFLQRVTLPPPPPQKPGKGELQVEIVRTFGNGSRHAGIDDISFRSDTPNPPGGPTATSTYAFAPGGDRAIFNLLAKSIRATKEFIYLEDQYLVADQPMFSVGGPISKILADKVAEPTFKKLIILVARTEQVNGELLQAWQRRRQFIGLIQSAGLTKVSVCHYKAKPGATILGEVPTFVHSKSWIFDDEFCLVSSANCNRRGYSHDSEIGAAIFDPNPRGDRLYFAHELRMRLWMKHLNPGGDKSITNRDILDPIAAARFWSKPPDIAAIEPYDQDGDKANPPNVTNPTPDTRIPARFTGAIQSAVGAILKDVNDDWDLVIDPDGS